MAEGGQFGYDDPDLDDKIDHDDDDDIDPSSYDDDAVKESLNKTQPFKPVRASSPYHGGEQVEMQTMHDEQTGMEETSYLETPLLSEIIDDEEKQTAIDKGIDFIKRLFPKADFKKIPPISFSKKGNQSEIVSLGPKGGEEKIFKKDGSGLLKSFEKRFSKALGPRAEEIIKEDRDTIQEQRQRLKEAEKQQREAEIIAAEREKESREMENLKQQIERTQARIDALQEEHGSNLESEAELQRLKLLKKNHQTEYENKKKEVAALEKQAKNKQKAERFQVKEQSSTKL